MNERLTDVEIQEERRKEENVYFKPADYDVTSWDRALANAQIAKLKDIGWTSFEEMERLSDIIRAAGRADGYKECQEYYASLTPEKVREEVAKYIYEHHHPRMFHTWGELKEKYHGSAEGIMQEADQILSILMGWVIERVDGVENPYSFSVGGAIPKWEQQYKGFSEAIQAVKKSLEEAQE